MTSGEISSLLDLVYERLFESYGPQHWWPGDSQFEVIAGAILTQSAAWTNVEKALTSMKSSGCWSFEALNQVPEAELAEIVRSSGYFNAKARKLKAFAAHVTGKYRGDLQEFFAKDAVLLRDELLSIHGIGEETADDIMVYAAQKPSFVIDTYTRRILDRMGLTPDCSSPKASPKASPKYRDYQDLFHRHLPADTALFNEFHALLDHHAKERCTKSTPRCLGCPLADRCQTGLAETK